MTPFLAIEQKLLFVSSLRPYLFKKKTIWTKKNKYEHDEEGQFFRDAEPWSDARFKRALGDLEIFLEVGNACVHQKPH